MSIKTNIAVAGCGHWGKNLVRNFHELGVLHSLCDNSPEIADKFSQQYAVPAYEWQDILDNAEIKAVVIASPAQFHFEMARAALKAGKDVYVEKPICLKDEDAQILCALAQENNQILMVGHLLQYHQAFLKMKEIVDQGTLGNIQYIYSNRLSFGKIRREENVLWSFAPHDMSMILALTNGEEPSFIDSSGACQTHGEIEDFATVNMRFPSGIAAHITVSWMNPFKEQKLVVIGDAGMAVFDDQEDWNKKLTHYPHNIDMSSNMSILTKAEGMPITLDAAEPLRAECAHFVQCVETRTAPRTDGEEGLRVLRALNKADDAMKKKRG